MTWGTNHAYPRAIVHVDGDSFFAACEVAKNPQLRGKPVITGKERGIVSAATYEAKARGIKRGMILSAVKKICPDAIILPSDYETYSLFSNRMYAIVRRYTPLVEEYSIDECFADITGFRSRFHTSYEEITAHIKHDLEAELNMTFSLGLSATKTLAKIGSKWQKPSGLTFLPLLKAKSFLRETLIGRVWGIGPNTAAFLTAHHIHTALDFIEKEESWVSHTLTKPSQQIWQELRGNEVLGFDTSGRASYQSISKTKTFTPSSNDPKFIFSQLSKNIENACIKARRWGLAASEIAFFLKTDDFAYRGYEVKLSHKTSAPQDILRIIHPIFLKLFDAHLRYRATGITLLKLSDETAVQFDLFGQVAMTGKLQAILKSMDEISERYGKHTVFLGSSMDAFSKGVLSGSRGDVAKRTLDLFKGETKRKRLAIPMLGEVT